MASSSKKLLKELPSSDDMKDTLVSLLVANDQAAALTGAAYLDHTLQTLLTVHFRKLNADDNNRMFDASANGILGSLASKVRVTYALRLIDRDVYDDLKLIIDIRNVFAHSLHRVGFDHALVTADCEKLKKAGPGFAGVSGQFGKERYLFTIFNMYFALMEKINQLGLANALMESGEHSPSPGKRE